MVRSLPEAPSLVGVRTCHSSLSWISSERFGRGGKSGAIGGEGLRTFHTPGKVAGEEQPTLIPPAGYMDLGTWLSVGRTVISHRHTTSPMGSQGLGKGAPRRPTS